MNFAKFFRKPPGDYFGLFNEDPKNMPHLDIKIWQFCISETEIQILKISHTQFILAINLPEFSCPKLAMKTSEECVKSVQISQKRHQNKVTDVSGAFTVNYFDVSIVDFKQVKTSWVKANIPFNPFQVCVVFHIETSHFICSVKQTTGLYMKCKLSWNGLHAFFI